MILSICINFRIGLMLGEEEYIIKLQILAAGVFINLFFLFLFKYETFVVTHLNEILGSRVPIRITGLKLSLPIGISFFTFQAISYLIDVYRKDAKVQTSVLNLGLYISFFPQLVAGPIVRYSTIAEQIESRQITYGKITYGIKRFIIGMSKKIIFANQFSLIAIESFSLEERSISFAWLGAVCYSLQIYYDFSGYSDMAIGLGKMFGFDFLENFNYPYISKTVTEFWQRWHISLGSWFRDYVYIPLGGSRVNKRRIIFNLFLVWLFTGIWHGAAWRFLTWGILYFVLLTFEKLTNIPNRFKYRVFKIFYQVFTLLMVMFGWIIFGGNSLLGSLEYIKSMFGLEHNQVFIDNNFIKNINNNGVLLFFSIIMATPLFSYLIDFFHQKAIYILKEKGEYYNIFHEYRATCIYLFIFFVSVSYLVMGTHNPFIYFNF